tara:strand:+ start:130 stop:606 length:477 start_codon:yes stop_codon:yes gene_type:complete
MKIIDNFLSDYEFKTLQAMFLSNQFSWYWGEEKVLGDNSEINYQFYHSFYEDNESYSNRNIKPIINKLDIRAIHKIKANLTLHTEKIYQYKFHTDVENFKCTTGVFYINTNDGYTLFENGDKIESISNRMLLFDSDKRHAGTTCTNAKRRVVLNLNFF